MARFAAAPAVPAVPIADPLAAPWPPAWRPRPREPARRPAAAAAAAWKRRALVSTADVPAERLVHVAALPPHLGAHLLASAEALQLRLHGLVVAALGARNGCRERLPVVRLVTPPAPRAQTGQLRPCQLRESSQGHLVDGHATVHQTAAGSLLPVLRSS